MCWRRAGAGEDVEAEVAAAFGPFVVLFGEDGADEADEGVAVGVDADDVALPDAPPAQNPRCPEDRRKPKRTAMFCLVAVSDDSQKATSSHLDGPGDPSQAWPELAPDYERARSREDSLDRLVEWPAQRDL